MMRSAASGHGNSSHAGTNMNSGAGPVEPLITGTVLQHDHWWLRP